MESVLNLLKGLKVIHPNVELNVVTFNTHCGKKFEQIKRVFQTHAVFQNADIIFLQEVEHKHTHESSEAMQLAKILGMNVYYADARPLKPGGSHGIAILSKLKLADTEMMQLPYFHSHLRPRTRIAQFSTVEINHEKILLVNVHLDVKVNLQERIAQLQPVLEKIKTIGISKVIMAGDFNTTPVYWYKGTFPVKIRRQTNGFKKFVKSHGFISANPIFGYTMRAGVVPLFLDAIFIKGMEITNSGVENSLKVSDHSPLWATIQV